MSLDRLLVSDVRPLLADWGEPVLYRPDGGAARLVVAVVNREPLDAAREDRGRTSISRLEVLVAKGTHKLRLPAGADEAWDEGDELFWSAGALTATDTTPASLPPAGVAAEPKLDGFTSALTTLAGVPTPTQDDWLELAAVYGGAARWRKLHSFLRDDPGAWQALLAR